MNKVLQNQLPSKFNLEDMHCELKEELLWPETGAHACFRA